MIGDILNFIAVFILGWIGIGSGIVYGKTGRRAYLPLSLELVEQGIYNEKIHRQIMVGLYSGCAIMVGLGTVLALWLCITGSGMTWFMAILGIALGLYKGRNAIADPKINAINFVRSRKIFMDTEKAEAYFRKKYGIS